MRLRNLLARLIRRLALTKDQIDRLPNNYTTQPLTDAGEPIRLANRLELPGDLFKKEGPWLQVVYWASGPAPVIPSGTQMLILTRMLAILPSGELVSTPLIESIELNDATSIVNPRSGVGLPMKNAAFHLSYQHPTRRPHC